MLYLLFLTKREYKTISSALININIIKKVSVNKLYIG